MDLVLLVLVLALPVLFIALIVRAIVRFIGTRLRGVALDYELPLSSREAVEYLAPHVQLIAQTAGYRLTRQTPSQIEYSRTYRPPWAILLAIFLFPLGLLFLLVKQKYVVSLSVIARDGRSRVTASGRAPRGTRDRIEQLLQEIGERQIEPGWYRREGGVEGDWDGEEWSEETRQPFVPHVVGPRMLAKQSKELVRVETKGGAGR